MEEYKVNLITEMHRLTASRKGLSDFMQDDTYGSLPMLDKGLVDAQFYHMGKYLETVIHRIERIKSKS